MSLFSKTLWTAIAIVGSMEKAAFVSHVGTPDKASTSTSQIQPLKPPATGKINVAFIISNGANVMDIAGAWEVFGDVMLTSMGKAQPDPEGTDMVMPFHTYKVSDSLEPVDAKGLTIVPNYTFDTAPRPQIIVIPAQGGRTPAQKKLLLARSSEADVTMSVCTGASMLAADGLLDGKTATTHHSYRQEMQKHYPAVRFVSGTRHVSQGRSEGPDCLICVRISPARFAISTSDKPCSKAKTGLFPIEATRVLCSVSKWFSSRSSQLFSAIA